MAVVLSGGINVWGEFSAPTVTDYIQGVVTFLLKAGWVLTTQIPASISNDYATTPIANALAVGAGGLTYVWKTSIDNAVARQVLVGATKGDSLVNMRKAINGESGSGTLYSNATTVNPLVVATVSSTLLTLTSRFEGPLGNGTPSSFGSLANGGYRLTGSAPQKRADDDTQALAVSAMFFDDQAGGSIKRGQNYLHSPDDPTIKTGARGMKVGAGITYRVVANRCQFFVYQPGVAASVDGSVICGGIPWIAPNSSCDSEITTGPVNEAFWASSDQRGSDPPSATPRTVIVMDQHWTQTGEQTTSTISTAGWFSSDGSYNGVTTPSGQGVGQFRMVSMTPPQIDASALVSSVKWLGEKALKLEPLTAWAPAGDNTLQPMIRGQIYDAVIVTEQVAMDTVETFDDNIWVALTDQSKFGTLWLIVPSLTPETLDSIQAHYAF